MLEDLGYRVTGVVGGPEALEVFGQSPEDFDLIITDLDMPGISGIRLAEAVTGIRPEMPIILCTGFSDGLDQEQGKSLGIREVLMKPLAIEDLALAARAALSS